MRMNSSITNPHHKPPDRRVLVADQLPGAGAVVADQHAMAHTGAEGIDCELRLAVGFAVAGQWLRNEQSPTGHAGMLDGRGGVADDVGELHSYQLSAISPQPCSNSQPLG